MATFFTIERLHVKLSSPPEEIIKELKRELQMRKKVYPGQINKGTLSRDQANAQYKALNSALQLLIQVQAYRTGKQQTINL